MKASASVVRSPLAWRGLIVMAACAILLAINPRAFPQSVPGGSTQVGHVPRAVLNATAKLLGPYEPTQMMRLVFSLRPPHMTEEEQFLQDLQTKGSPQFHRFLTANEWNARFAPSPQDEQRVVDWAQSEGLTITQRYANRLLVDVEAPAGSVQRALSVAINSYRLGDETYFSNDRKPSIPASLAGIVQGVLGLNNLEAMTPAGNAAHAVNNPAYVPGPVKAMGASMGGDGDPSRRPSPRARLSIAPVGPRGDNSPADPANIWSAAAYDFAALYNLSHCCNPLGNAGGSPPPASIAIATSGDVQFTDLQAFASAYGLAWKVQTYYVDGTPTCGGATPQAAQAAQDACLETTMDIEWSTAMSNSFGAENDTAEVFVYEGANSLSSTFVDVYNTILNSSQARVLSTSWGCTENPLNTTYVQGTAQWQFSCAPCTDDISITWSGLLPTVSLTCDNSEMYLMHNIFGQMVGEGWTIVAAAGDHGATDDCTTLSVHYPASDPYVVAAGGSQLSENYSNPDVLYFSGEVAWTGGTYQYACAGNPPGSRGNNGGGGGGKSNFFVAPPYQLYPSVEAFTLGTPVRAVPDLSLNAAGGTQNIYFQGNWTGGGGTSIVAPELAGFFAQENAYLLYICQNGNPNCPVVLGQVGYFLYAEGSDSPNAPKSAPHYPFYDITSGCNSNDVTAGPPALTPYCAAPGYDMATGWGSANMMQLAWAINWWLVGQTGWTPTVGLSGPLEPEHWYNASTGSQPININIVLSGGGVLPSSGIAGFSWQWDRPLADAPTEAMPLTPENDNPFYDGPQFTTTSGNVYLNSAGEGQHTLHVEGWDNAGISSGEQTFGSFWYDSIPPTTTQVLAPSPNGAGWNNTTVNVTLHASDPGFPTTGSGVEFTYYALDAPGCSPANVHLCSAVFFSITPLIAFTPFSIASEGAHTVYGFSMDVAGNIETPRSFPVNIDETPPHTTASVNGVQVTLSATDNLSGVASTVYQIDGGPVQSYRGPFVVSIAGSHTVTFHSTDVAGNVETTESVSFSITPVTITSVTPNEGIAGSGATPITIAGSNFGGGSTVSFTLPGGTPTPITMNAISAAQIAATIPAVLLTSPATAQVAVTNGLGVLSNQAPFYILPFGVGGVMPAAIPQGSGPTVVTVSGANLSSANTLSFTPPRGAPVTIPLSAIQAAQGAATIPAVYLTSAGTAQVALANSVGQQSNQLTLYITPFTISSATPGAVPSGSGATVVTVTGENLSSATTMSFTPPGGAPTSLSLNTILSAQAAATVPAALLSSAGTATVALANGAAVLSNQLPFTISTGASAQTIAFGTIPGKTLGSAPFPITAAASSGLAVSLLSNTTPVCTVSGSNVVTLLTAGFCSITASQAGNGSYNPTTPVTRGFDVTPAMGASGTLTGAAGSPFAVGANPAGMTVGDFNGDGLPDLALSGNGNVTVLLGTGSGGFQQAGGGPITVGSAPLQLAAADFNGDGRQDLAIVNPGSDNVTVLLGDGTGGFQQAAGSPIAVGNQPNSILVSDFNGDGIPDLAIANQSDNTITVLLGNGTGGFTPAPGNPFAVGNLPVGIAAGDFNGDGIPDIVTANFNDGTVSLLLGDGVGGFTPVLGDPFAVGSGPEGIVAGDFNGDGLLDFAVTNWSGGSGTTVTVMLGNGSGGFGSPEPMPAGTAPTAIIAADFNGDGILDLAVGHGNGRANLATTVMLGDGTGRFTTGANSSFAAGFGGGSLAAADFNRDGKLDLAIANNTQPGNVVVLLGAIAATNSVLSTTSPVTVGLGASVPLTLSVSDLGSAFTVPTGTAVFQDGPAVLGTASQIGSPYTFSTASLALGSHSLTGVYSGAAGSAGSTSNTVTIHVLKDQTITFGSLANRTLGTGPFALNATASSGLPVTFASQSLSICTVAGARVTLLAQGTCSITASQPGNGTYVAATPVTQEFLVLLAQTITFNPLPNEPLNETPAPLSAKASSNLGVTFTSDTPTTCTVNGANITLVAAGSCAITANQSGNSTYAAAPSVTQKFTVLKLQTIDFNAPANQIFGSTPAALKATATSGLPVTFASTTTPVCTVSGTTIKLVTDGICTIAANQAGNTTYAPAPQVTQSFTVFLSQKITFAAIENQPNGGKLTLTATASSGLTVAYTSTTQTVCTVTGNEASFIAPGSCSITANQAGNGTYAPAAAVTQSFKVLAASAVAFGRLNEAEPGAESLR